ncbi:MAG: hypothetical protein LBG19_01100 [Prevotellaceae bacterium]|nr:hypothetical protein [Prevotellaceae bacterium]
MSDGTEHIGSYTISGDLTTITLEGLGTIVLGTLTNEKLELTFTPVGTTTAQAISCVHLLLHRSLRRTMK